MRIKFYEHNSVSDYPWRHSHRNWVCSASAQGSEGRIVHKAPRVILNQTNPLDGLSIAQSHSHTNTRTGTQSHKHTSTQTHTHTETDTTATNFIVSSGTHTKIIIVNGHGHELHCFLWIYRRRVPITVFRNTMEVQRSIFHSTRKWR